MTAAAKFASSMQQPGAVWVHAGDFIFQPGHDSTRLHVLHGMTNLIRIKPTVCPLFSIRSLSQCHFFDVSCLSCFTSFTKISINASTQFWAIQLAELGQSGLELQ